MFINYLFLIICIILCMYARLQVLEEARTLDSLDLELQTVANYHVYAGNQNLVPLQNSKSS